MTRRTWGLSIVLLGTVAATAGDLLPYHRRARVRCGAPAIYEYEHKSTSLPDLRETSATLTLVAVQPPTNSVLTSADPRRTVRFWQVVDRPLKLDHCSLSGIAVWIDETGSWSASMTATQQPYVGPGRQATPAVRFLRNKFHVKVHAYGLAKVQSGDRASMVGQPEIFCMCLNPFWVDREQVLIHNDGGRLTDDQLQRLPLVDRLVVEFRYE